MPPADLVGQPVAAQVDVAIALGIDRLDFDAAGRRVVGHGRRHAPHQGVEEVLHRVGALVLTQEDRRLAVDDCEGALSVRCSWQAP